MKKQQNLNRISRQMSFLLRHNRDYIDLNGGWAEINVIIHTLQQKYPAFTMEDLKTIVDTDTKGRYSFDSTGTKIRANQGHSVPGVIIEMEHPEPPEVLYHGTATRFLDSIMREGLKPMNRLFVHISSTPEVAKATGRRHGDPVVLEVAARQMISDGLELSRSANGVWQAKAVPVKYLKIRESE